MMKPNLVDRINELAAGLDDQRDQIEWSLREYYSGVEDKEFETVVSAIAIYERMRIELKVLEEIRQGMELQIQSQVFCTSHGMGVKLTPKERDWTIAMCVALGIKPE